MMPFVIQRSGPDFMRNGQLVSPEAEIGICEGCGYQHASFEDKSGNTRLAYCGYREGKPQCIAMKRKDEAA